MPTLYVTQPNTVVRVSGDTLRVTAGHRDGGKDEEILRVECHRLENVLVFGRVHVTADALRHCLAKGIGISFFSKNGKFLGQCTPPRALSADLPWRQLQMLGNPARRLAFAKFFIAAKVQNSRTVLQGLRSNYPAAEISAAIKSLGAVLEKVKKASGNEELLGIEGNAAKIYFAAFPAVFRGEIAFSARRQHPAPDPANALLSFAYVILGNKIAGMLQGRGLLPDVGNFHELRAGRASLALDMLEEFRAAVVDRFVLRLCNLRIMRPEMFMPDDGGGVRLESAAQKVFFAEWEKWLNQPLRGGEATVLKTLEKQINLYAAALRRKSVYRPFIFGKGKTDEN